MIDWTVNVGNLLIGGTMIVGGVGFLYTMRSRLDALSSRMIVIEKDLQRIVDILVVQARLEERLNALEARFNAAND